MIDNLTLTSPFLTTNSYHAPVVADNGQLSGEMRMNTSTQQVEAYNGTTWVTISGSVTVGLSREADEILRWAGFKMRADDELESKMKKYPTLEAAYEQFKMVEALVYEEEKRGT